MFQPALMDVDGVAEELVVCEFADPLDLSLMQRFPCSFLVSELHAVLMSAALNPANVPILILLAEA